MTRTHARKVLGPATIMALAGMIAMGGCVSRSHTERVTTSEPAVVTPSDRVGMADNGRWELRGDGRVTPYYWVWIPAGAAVVSPPPAPPPLPR